MINYEKLIYICQYGKNKERAWSGTYYKVYKELSELFPTEEMDLKVSLATRLRLKLSKMIPFFSYDFMFGDIKKYVKLMDEKTKDKNCCTFQYFETPSRNNVHSYIYQDMCVEYLDNNILSRPKLRALYPFKRFSKKVIESRKKGQREFYSTCAGVFTMGKWLADYMVNVMGIPAEKIHCVGAGIDINSELIHPEKKEGNKVLFIGRDFERKGGYLLLEAFKKLREQYVPNAVLYIIGPAENPLTEAIPGVEYVGPKSPDQLMSYYNTCDVFCMPSYVEPYGKVYIEALCSGVPCIARNLFSGPEIIENGVNGYLLDNDSSDTLAELLRDALNNKSMGEYVRSHMEEYRDLYSWKTVIKKMAEVISKDPFMNS